MKFSLKVRPLITLGSIALYGEGLGKIQLILSELVTLPKADAINTVFTQEEKAGAVKKQKP
jgi:hypothetical protein